MPTARRQGSSTSLSRYARSSPVPQNRSLDFCNAFWGPGDGGVDVLFARMRGAARTVEEIRNFWKERASIEEDYAKRLARLAKMPLGRDEIGELRNSLETLRAETEHQASSHLQLAHQVRSDLEMPAAAFYTRQMSHKKVQQAQIEKDLKTKQTQEAYVNKAREKYEQDCIRINSFTAQASLVQGKDLEKVNLKLERTQQTVQTNEREFASYAKALAETVQKWETNWKNFCDSSQDLEEDRLDFMKDNAWAYANAVSTVCVSDDESCEKIRLALEQLETDKDMENFVHEYGTGNLIPDPPTFVNYQNADAIPSSSARATSRPASFNRSTTRDLSLMRGPAPEEEDGLMNTAGIGAGGGVRRADTYYEASDSSRQRRDSFVPPVLPPPHQPVQQQQLLTNGTSHHNHNGLAGNTPSPVSSTQASAAFQRGNAISPQARLQSVLQDPHAEPIDPTAETYIKVGNNAYKADPSKDPQQSGGPSSIRSTAPSPMKPTNGDVDPLMRQLEQLESVVGASGSMRRNTLIKPRPEQQAQQQQGQKIGHASSISASMRSGTTPSSGRSSALSPPDSSLGAPSVTPNRSPSPGRDYRNSAEMVVGPHPSISRSPSPAPGPAPPTAAFMVPKRATTPVGPDPDVVQDVLAGYQQSLPGERKPISRSNSTKGHTPSLSQASIHSQQSLSQVQNQLQNLTQAQGQNLARPSSQMGHAGIGAHGSRSNSPQPISRGPSPAPPPSLNTANRMNYIQPPMSSPVRSASPNPVGIALDPNGRVMHDELAQRYQQQQQQQQQQRPPPVQAQAPMYNTSPAHSPSMMMQQQQQQARRSSYMAPPMAGTPYAAVTPPPPPVMYQSTSPQPGYVQAPPQQMYNAPPPPIQYQQPAPLQTQNRYSGQGQQQQQQQQAPGYGYNASPNGLQRGGSAAYFGNGSGTPPQQHQAPQQQQQQVRAVQQQQPVYQPVQQQQSAYQPPAQQYNARSAMQQTPSPAPDPRQTTDDGSQILFYVKALYDYTATIEEEFDFQAGDIIAVTATPEDGWWSGELLDEARRQRGRNVFPSNFVCLF